MRPLAAAVPAVSFAAASKSRSGSPRQFDNMNEKSRCSTLFHLLVPGGKWYAAIPSCVSFAHRCSSSFHTPRRQPLLPPAFAVMKIWVAFG